MQVALRNIQHLQLETLDTLMVVMLYDTSNAYLHPRKVLFLHLCTRVLKPHRQKVKHLFSVEWQWTQIGVKNFTVKK